VAAPVSADSRPGGATGSFAEESARLVGAFREWASRGQEAANSFAAQRSSPTSAAEQGPECAFCPICQGLALLRGAKPEVAEHLVEALSSLAAAVAALLPGEEAAPASARRPRASAEHQHIDVSGDEPGAPAN
jgi:hypothetical protein